MYSEWAAGQCAKIGNILNAAREDHTAAVKERIQGVKGMEGVVETTKAMFEVSKVRTRLIRMGCFSLKCYVGYVHIYILMRV